MAQPSKPKMGKKTPKVNAKALTSTRKSDKAANPKSPRNLRDMKITKERLAYEKGFNAAMKKKNSKKVLGGDTY
jgi:hypothetical protein